jgi:hypothetical protein
LLSFEDFAKQSFKVNSLYATQALAILNYSPDLLDDAKQDLAGIYKTYQARVADDRAKRQNMKFLEAPENSDIKERVANANLALDEAITLLRARHEDDVRRIEAAAEARAISRKQFKNLADFLYHFHDADAETLASYVNTEKGDDLISGPDKRPFGKEEMLKVAQLLTKAANAIN